MDDYEGLLPIDLSQLSQAELDAVLVRAFGLLQECAYNRVAAAVAEARRRLACDADELWYTKQQVAEALAPDGTEQLLARLRAKAGPFRVTFHPSGEQVPVDDVRVAGDGEQLEFFYAGEWWDARELQAQRRRVEVRDLVTEALKTCGMKRVEQIAALVEPETDSTGGHDRD